MNIYLAIALFVVALGYSAAGLGGGTGYLAVLSFWSHDLNLLRPLSWGLQIIVASIGFFNFHRAGHFSLNFALPIILGGTIGGAVGDRLPISSTVFTAMLAVMLLLVAVKMFVGYRSAAAADEARVLPWGAKFAIGFGTGVIAGMLGSGGGVILGPVILMLRLADIKRSAATTSLFVVLTSSGALGTHVLRGGAVDFSTLATYGAICVVGAYFGSLFGARKASTRLLELGFGTILLVAGIRLAWKAIGA